MSKLKFTVFLIATFLMAACTENKNKVLLQTIPSSWYHSEEDSSKDLVEYEDKGQEEESFEGYPELNQSITQLLAVDSEALEEGDTQAQEDLGENGFYHSEESFLMTKMASNEMKPKDWVPWRAEYFMTDLSLTGSGFIGALVLKGTSTVRAYWRKQGPKIGGASAVHTEEENSEPIVIVNELSTSKEMVQQLEPAIQAAIRTGKIKDTPVLRKNLLQTAREFQTIAVGIPSFNGSLPWWVSRFRLDFTVDAAGRVEPVGMVGGEVRFRFEWHRLKKVKSTSKRASLILSEKEKALRSSLKEFIVATAYDLHEVFENHSQFGFKAHQMRMGIGISVKGNIGIVKGSAGVVGQIYFNRNVERPHLYPIRKQILSLKEEEVPPLLIIERHPAPEHLILASNLGLPMEVYSTKKRAIDSSDENQEGFEEAVYRLERKKFRKGLKKAAKIGAFFAKRAAEVKTKNWKIYELRTAFDASISGGLDLVTLVGSATAQISMFNENF